MENLLQQLSAFVVGLGSRLLMAALVLLIGIKLIRWLVKRVAKSKALDHIDANLHTFLSSGLSIGLYALLFIICANVLGIDTTSFITVLASCGVAIGLALQGALSNVAGGLMILIFRPFRVGDYIDAGGTAGTVKAITVFYTILETPDNKQITVPNGNLTSVAITNCSVNGKRRVDLEFSASYTADVDQVKALMKSVALAHAKVAQQPEPPFARLTKQGESALVFTLRVWCNNADYWEVYFDLLEGMKKAFDENGVSIPYPQLDVHLVQ